jgi:hypothetical protein
MGERNISPICPKFIGSEARPLIIAGQQRFRGISRCITRMAILGLLGASAAQRARLLGGCRDAPRRRKSCPMHRFRGRHQAAAVLHDQCGYQCGCLARRRRRHRKGEGGYLQRGGQYLEIRHRERADHLHSRHRRDDTLGAVGLGDIVEVDVTSAIQQDGQYSFAINSSHSNGAEYRSRENSPNTPVLLVTLEPTS